MEKVMKNMLVVLILIISTPMLSWAESSVFVTIAPQKFFVDKISGGQIPVSVMITPGANPHAYEPKPSQMAMLARAEVYFAIGDSFDRVWLERLKKVNPSMAVVHTDAGATKIPIHDASQGHGKAPPRTEEDGPHSHGGWEGSDPHIWLDPKLVEIQAAHIRDGLTAADPAHAAAYAANYAAFVRELDEMDREIRVLLAPIPKARRTFLVFHPSWGYFARAYGLNQACIEVEGKEPSPRELARIIDMGQKQGIKAVFVQPQFSEKSAAVISEQIGARVVRLDPLAENWAENLRHAARVLAENLQ
ncbi:MAG: zinc ABC transporter solute-binding protein [Desulfovibrionales bacterium]|nr:zinc ABC transporter solute-binding protein [Desulfovibrionales bacterium]